MNELMSKSCRTTMLMAVLTAVLCVLFVADLTLGSVRIPFADVFDTFFKGNDSNINSQILMDFRLPKAITAVLSGFALALSGMLMQSLFQNPLAGPDVLGVSSGASLGVALFVMSSGLLPVGVAASGWGLVVSAIVGSVAVLLLMLASSFKIHNSVSLLLVGLMVGSMASAVVCVLQNHSNPDSLKLFVVWSMGSLSSVSWSYLKVLSFLVVVGVLMSMMLNKRLNALLLGESYAQGLGVNIVRTRVLIIIATSLLAGTTTAFTGPIAFIGVAVPHVARGLFKTSNHAVVAPSSMLCGAVLLLVCDLVSQLSVYTIPINAVSALFGAPLLIWIVLKQR